MRKLLLSAVFLIPTGAFGASYCPPGLALDSLHRCVCPTGRYTQFELIRRGVGGEQVCLEGDFPVPDTHTRGGVVSLFNGGENGAFADNPACPGCGVNPTSGGGGGGGGGGKGCGHGGGGNCGVGLGNGGGNGTGNEGNGKGPPGGQVHAEHPIHPN